MVNPHETRSQQVLCEKSNQDRAEDSRSACHMIRSDMFSYSLQEVKGHLYILHACLYRGKDLSEEMFPQLLQAI